MKIYTEQSLADFKFWSGAETTAQRIWEEQGSEGFDQLEAILEDLYPDGIDETDLNDLLWFDADTVYEWLGIEDEEDEDEDDEDADDDDNEEETEPTNDYVINVGDSWDDLTPKETFSTEQDAISTAKTMSQVLPDKCIEVVYSPCNDVDTNEIIWRKPN
jgi:hypothetical protein